MLKKVHSILWEESHHNHMIRFSLDIAIHKSNSPIIILIVPGVNGTLDGYKGKYLTIASHIQQKHHYAVVRMNNPFVSTLFWESNLRKALSFVLEHSREICRHTNPKIYVFANAIGAAVVAQIGWEYPEIKKLLLINTSTYLKTNSICKGLSLFKGDSIVLIFGKDDPSRLRARKIFRSCPKGKARIKIMPYIDHRSFSKERVKTFISLPEKYLLKEL